MRHIVTISGGVASAWVAKWVKDNIQGEIIYYFNDTKWEHPDLYRFLAEIEKAIGIKITYDNDGRNPEQVFYDQKMLGSNRAPICSKILKANRLQKFCKPGDILYFGIDGSELKRAARITPIYERIQCKTTFPLIDLMVTKEDVFNEIRLMGIEIPELYKRGFTHNNCSGGCVRAGIKQWSLLYKTFPDVYLDRMRIEEEFSAKTGGGYHFMKELSLKQLKAIIDQQMELPFDDEIWSGECIGICNVMA